MKLSTKALIIAFALLQAISFLFVALLNLLLPPYGGAYLAILISLYPGYDPVSGPVSLIVGVAYTLLAGALSGALLGWFYNHFR